MGECKAESYTVHHNGDDRYGIAYSETRYRMVDAETGKIVDDAQGYGYKTAQKAYAAWSYKHRDKRKDAATKAKEKQIRKWMNEHADFIDAMEEYAFEIEVKHSWEPEDKFNAAFVNKMLTDYHLKPDFTAAELLRVWRKS